MALFAYDPMKLTEVDEARMKTLDQMRVHLNPNVVPYDKAKHPALVDESDKEDIPLEEKGWQTEWELKQRKSYEEDGAKDFPHCHVGSYRSWHRSAWVRQDQKYLNAEERTRVLRNIVVDDGTKSLQEQIVEWNHKPENIRTLNDWIDTWDVDNYAEYYYATHQNDVLPERGFCDVNKGRSAGFGQERFQRRGALLEATLVKYALPKHEEDMRAALLAMRIIQQMPNVMWSSSSLGDILKPSDGDEINEKGIYAPWGDFVDTAGCTPFINGYHLDTAMSIEMGGFKPIRPCWSYRIDPDEHVRETAQRIIWGDNVAEEEYKRAENDKDGFVTTRLLELIIGNDETKKVGEPGYIIYAKTINEDDYEVKIPHSDEPYDPDTKTAYPDYGWRQTIDSDYRSGSDDGLDDGESVLANRALLEKLFADPDFDMMTGYSRSTGKRVFPKYYDKDGNEMEEYQFRFGTPYSGYIGIIKRHFTPESLEKWEETRAEQRRKAVERIQQEGCRSRDPKIDKNGRVWG